MTETVSGASDLDDDVFSPSAIRDPYTYYGRIRETDPVRWNERHRVWGVTRFNDVARINRRPKVFSSAIVNTAEKPHPPIRDEDLGELQFVRKNTTRRVILTDPPEHTAESERARRYLVTPSPGQIGEP
jgi:cytochrome P450